jgi:dienelactone hydrolase
VERQLGPRCIRDKILIQTEPGMWIPSYVVYPRKAPKKMPALLYLHGSGPGKQAFAPDEEEIYSRPATDLDLPSIAYRFARDFGCLVYVPDQRGWGEWAESNHVQAPQRGQQAGFNILALMMWDHLRAIDYLCARPDVDSARIGCFGSSGGGQATIFTAGIDERVAAAMISSTFVYPSALPEQYFHRMAPDPNQPFWPPPAFPAATVQTCALTIPRALWIIDGTHDICWLENNSGPDRATAFARARARLQAARDELARLYTLMGAPEKFRSTWFEGDHCAGFTYANCREWFGKWLRL